MESRNNISLIQPKGNPVLMNHSICGFRIKKFKTFTGMDQLSERVKATLDLNPDHSEVRD